MELVNDFTVAADISETWKTLTDLELIAPCMPGAQLTEVEGETYRGLVKIKVGPITAQFKGQAHFVERDADAHKAVLKADGRDTGGKGNASALITAQLVEVTPTTTKVTVTTDLTITGKVAQFGRGALVDVSDKLLKQFVHNLETTVLSEDAAHHTPTPAPTPVEPPAEVETPAATEPEVAGEPSTEAESETTEAAPAASFAPPVRALITSSEPPAPVAEGPTAAKHPESAVAGASAAAPSPGVRKIESKPVEPIDLLETAGAPMLKRLAPVLGVLVVLLFVLRRRRS